MSTFEDSAIELLKIQSTSDNPKALVGAVQYLQNIVSQVEGVTIETFNSNNKPSFLAYFGSQRPRQFKVLLNGHVDVVPAQDGQFSPYMKDGRLHGRGALDMKVAALVLTQLFCEFAPKVNYPLGLQIVSDEETGGHNGTAHQLAKGVTTDFVLSGEMSGPTRICTESRGVCWAKILFTGKAAHSAYLWEGQNAILQMNSYIDKLLRHYPVPASEEWRTTVNVSRVSTENTTTNRVPDNAEVLLDIRFVKEDRHFASKQDVCGFLQSIQPGVHVDLLALEPAHKVATDDYFVSVLDQSIYKTLHKPATHFRKHGAADMRFYSANGAAAVAYGLDGENIHGDNEYLYLAAVSDYRKVLTLFLQSV